MAAAPSPRVAPATGPRGLPRALLPLVPAALVAAAVACAMRLVYDPWYLNYDARYALLWAQDAGNGFLPEYEADYAPTPRPLQTLVGLIALPLGNRADELMVWAVLLAFGALVWLAFRLGSELFSPWVGAVTALVVLTRPALQRDALLAYQDLPFAALVVGAVLLEVRRPRRGVPVLCVLAVAGLIRPEAWVLSGLYALWLWRDADRGQRLRYAALAAAAPLTWAALDLIVTGDPLHSLHGTAALAEENDRRRHIWQSPRWTLQYLGFTLREPLVVGVPLGLAFAWRHRRHRAILPLAVAAAMLLVFAAGPLFGLPLIGRYVRTPAVLLALFYGLAVFGWMLLPPGRERRGWMVAGAVAGLLSIGWLPWHVEKLRGLEQRIERDGALYGDLRTAARAPAVERAFAACAPLSAADHRPIPYVRDWLDGDPGSVGTVEGGASPLGRLLLVPLEVRRVERFYREEFPRVAPPEDYRTLYENRSWRVYAAPGCGA